MVLIVVGEVGWLDGDLHGNWSLLVDWESDVLFVDDWTIDWHMDMIRHWLLDDIWDLLDDFHWSWDWNLHWNMDVLFNFNLIRSGNLNIVSLCHCFNGLEKVSPVNFDMNWILHFFQDLNWVWSFHFNWVRCWDMTEKWMSLKILPSSFLRDLDQFVKICDLRF